MDGLGYLCALLLAAVFVRAGAAKLARPATTAASFSALGVPAPGVSAVAVPLVELLAAVVLAVVPRVGGTAALVLLFGFSALVARAVRRGSTAPCNCFGAARADPVSGVDLVRNAMLAALALAALTASGPEMPGLWALPALLAAAGAGALAMRSLRRGATA